jgi:hypothetical protein
MGKTIAEKLYFIGVQLITSVEYSVLHWHFSSAFCMLQSDQKA